ncbi:MAG: acyloxyacyl hydrolase [Acidobacteria bacterium]|nr:acyloxyacyl hydrolase [Acidobacteriota bacterium]MCA1636823.1 acyloxyacyl hydrolase [Acidobacteriota bacterium]
MNLFRPSRSVTLWLIIIFSFTFVQAQNSSNGIDNSTKSTKNESASSKKSTNFFPRRIENDFSGSKSFSPVKTRIDNEYEKQTESGSNKEWGYYAGSFTVHKDLKGESQKAPVVLFGIRHAWSMKNNPSHRFRYYMDLNPLIIVNYRQRRLVQTSPSTTAVVNGDRKTVFGVGFVPLGLQFNWRNSKKIQPYIAGGMGVALFNKKFPDNRSALEPDEIGNRFQIMPEFGAGVEIRNSETKSYFIGYKYHHMSNGYTAPLNVGYNTNMVYFGMYLQRGR